MANQIQSIHGIDTSMWQGDYNEAILNKDKTSFFVIKATEGVGYTDPQFYKQQNDIRVNRPDAILGYYHFAQFDLGNSGREEAEYFINICQPRIGEFLALDIEQGCDLVQYVPHAVEFVNVIKEKLGYTPLVYLNLSTARKAGFKALANTGAGLWLAYYGSNNGDYNSPPEVPNWEVIAMEQYTSVGKLDGHNGDLDFNVFFGPVEQLSKYCIQKNESIVIPEAVVTYTQSQLDEIVGSIKVEAQRDIANNALLSDRYNYKKLYERLQAGEESVEVIEFNDFLSEKLKQATSEYLPLLESKDKQIEEINHQKIQIGLELSNANSRLQEFSAEVESSRNVYENTLRELKSRTEKWDWDKVWVGLSRNQVLQSMTLVVLTYLSTSFSTYFGMQFDPVVVNNVIYLECLPMILATWNNSKKI